jgi:glycosyltransferase involved in cell wall biosynthesis
VRSLARLMDHAKLRKQVGKSGRARVVEHFDLRLNVERLARVFAERMQS